MKSNLNEKDFVGKKFNGGITFPTGFYAIGGHSGIKKSKKDLAIVYTIKSAKVGAVFTKNLVKAAPLKWNMMMLNQRNEFRAIIINSGNANACTGVIGDKNVELMAKTLAECLKIPKESVLVASTGVIGVQLPIEKICDGIKKFSKMLGNSNEESLKAAEAIMTTDTHPKQVAIEFKIGSKNVRIGGMAKGAGMIHPNMATMLAFITTDINISSELLQQALTETVENSYNMISVDGDTSTNDMVIIMANGMASNKEIIDENDDYYRIFKLALNFVNKYLAVEIVKDGEGASKLIIANVKGASSKRDAKLISKAIVTSNLVKTAIYGEDPNWGRILAAMGYSGVKFDPSSITIKFINGKNEVTVFDQGFPIPIGLNIIKEIMKSKEIIIEINLKEGNEKAIAWGCDLTPEYVKINSQYTT